MSEFNNYQTQSRAQTIDRAEVDAGLRAYMLRVYNYMAAALAVTGVVALGTATLAQSSPAFAQALYFSPLKWVVFLAPLGMIFFLGHAINKLSVGAAQTAFWVFAALIGVSMSSIFLVFTATSIAQTFFVTAGAFGALSIYGYTTQRDLSGMGTFLFMGLIGLVLAMVVNFFLQSSAMQFAISVIGVLIFAGLTAYDTQKIKNTFDYVAHDGELMARSAINGALALYLDFINMFQFLLHFLGNSE
jgi:FtsH-binding integral membrane protein